MQFDSRWCEKSWKSSFLKISLRYPCYQNHGCNANLALQNIVSNLAQMWKSFLAALDSDAPFSCAGGVERLRTRLSCLPSWLETGPHPSAASLSRWGGSPYAPAR